MCKTCPASQCQNVFHLLVPSPTPFMSNLKAGEEFGEILDRCLTIARTTMPAKSNRAAIKATKWNDRNATIIKAKNIRNSPGKKLLVGTS
ncbi:MAG: hypothetical protein BBJ60_11930 [Desulfobacterales bacterium S7086C20]|nr:MAG: hypothetical protein BBJ60_11930 [Desulfobacterales bacterium S7086C20]